MEKLYTLKQAIILNATREKYNAVAMPVSKTELKKHQHQFREFDFLNFLKNNISVYKICKQGELDILQGLVAFTQREGFVYCHNMEVNDFNKKPVLLYGGVGKCIIALCCKISHDIGNDGVINFEAKNRLFNYYRKFGALQLGGSNRFFINERMANRLIAIYF